MFPRKQSKPLPGKHNKTPMPRPYTKGLRSTVYNRNKVETARATIDAERMLKLLQQNALGEIELDTVRQKSIEICLRKALPDLSAVEVEQTNAAPFAVIPSQSKDAKAWEASVTKAPEKPPAQSPSTLKH